MYSFAAISMLFCLFACNPAGEPGLCHIASQGSKYTLNTKQNCTLSSEARTIGDLSHLLSLQALAEEGLLNYTSVVEDLDDNGIPMVCLVARPEPCCLSGICKGPYNTNKTLATRKAGCSSSYHAWASLTWPPTCNLNWPDEPHCIQKTEDRNPNYDWRETLRHEVFNTVVQRWTNIYDPSYRNKIYTEVEPLVQKRFKAILER